MSSLLSHLCTLLKPLDGTRCRDKHPNNTVPSREGYVWASEPPIATGSELLLVFARCQQQCHVEAAYCQTTLAVVSEVTVYFILKQSAQVQYNCNTRIFSCVAVVLQLRGSLQHNAAIQVFYNLQKTCRLLAAVVKKTCIAVVLRFCGLLQYNQIFVLCYCSCIVVVLHLCGPL